MNSKPTVHRTAHRERGVALLTAVLVVAVATVLAVNIMWESSVDLQRTENLLLQDQARQYALGAEVGAIELLAEDSRDDGPTGSDDLQEPWAQVGTQAPFAVEGGGVTLTLNDATGRFNLNNLVVRKTGELRPVHVQQFRQLLLALPLDSPMDPGTAEKIVYSTVDWIDPDTVPDVNGAEDDVYMNRIPSYRTANFWFTSTSELLAVEGMTAEIFAALAPHITALPPELDQPSGINVNTATPVVLASLAPGLSPDDTVAIAGGAYTDPLEFVKDFGDSLGSIEPNELSSQLAVRSLWFESTVTASIGTTRARLYSLLERDGQSVRARLRTYDAK